MDFNALVTRFQQQLRPNKRQKTDNLNNNSSSPEPIPWNWVCSSLISILEKYASGATEAIILSELQTKWDETPKDWNDSVETKVAGMNAIGETQTVGMLEARVVSSRCLPNTNVWLVTIQDSNGTKMDHYLHPQLSELVAGPCPLLVSGRGIRMVGTRASTIGSPPLPVLLPTTLLGVMLGTVHGVFDDHLTDPFETTPLSQLQAFRNTRGACTIAAKVLGVRGSSIYLSDPNSQCTVSLELPATHRQMVQLVRKGEILRISPHVPPTFDPAHPSTSSIHYTPGTLICILATSNAGSVDGVEVLAVGGGHGSIRDMRYARGRTKIGEIGPSMTGIHVVGKITKMLRNLPTADNYPRYPVQLSDVPSPSQAQPRAVDVTVWWDIANQLRTLRQGMLVYAENLFATTPKDSTTANQAPKYNVIASREYNTRLRAISTLPAILTSSLFPSSLLSTAHALAQSSIPYLHQPSNFIVRATILDFKTPGPEPPVYAAHAACLRIAQPSDLALECRWCGTRAQATDKGIWEKVFNLQWLIGDGSAECWAQASARVHEVILQMKASAFVELDNAEQRRNLVNAISANYLFSLSLAVEGQKKYLRIDQLVAPNPVVETRKLVDDLSNFPW